MTAPELSTALAAAFALTTFEVHGAHPATLTVSDTSQACAAWLDAARAQQAVVVTAWNPFGAAQSAQANSSANAQLCTEIEAAGLAWQPARGVSTANDWFEDSYCVFDAPSAVIDGWLRSFDQHAVLRVRRGESPALVWHPDHR